MICGKCGKEIRDDAVFCPACGAKLDVSGRKNRVVPVAIVSILVLIVAIAFFLSNRKNTPTQSTMEDKNEESVNQANSDSTQTEPIRDSLEEQNKDNEKATQSQNNRDSLATSVYLNWHTLSAKETLSDGYIFEKTMMLSPWICATETDTIQAYWSKVSSTTFRGKEYTAWGNQADAETWYLIGSYMQRNITDGFSFSESNSHSTGLRLAAELTEDRGNGFKNQGFISLVVYFSNGASTWRTTELEGGIANGLAAITHTSDTWGPVPICFVVFNPISPNNPDGMDITQTKIKLTGDDIFQINDFSDESGAH